MPPKQKNKVKKSVERSTKMSKSNNAKGNDNQQQIVNVTVNIPSEKKKKKKKEESEEESIDPEAVKQLEANITEYQSLVQRANELGITLSPDLKLNVDPGDVKTTEDVLALNNRVTNIIRGISELLENNRGAQGFNEIPNSALFGIGVVPQMPAMKSRPGFNPQSNYDNVPNIVTPTQQTTLLPKQTPPQPSTKKEKPKETFIDTLPIQPNMTLIGLQDKRKPTSADVVDKARFLEFLKEVSGVDSYSDIDNYFSDKNIEANSQNGASIEDVNLAVHYQVASKLLQDTYPRKTFHNSRLGWTTGSGFALFWGKVGELLRQQGQQFYVEPATWNQNTTAAITIRMKMKFDFLDIVGNLGSGNSTSAQDLLDTQMSQLANELSAPKTPEATTTPTTHGAPAQVTGKPHARPSHGRPETYRPRFPGIP